METIHCTGHTEGACQCSGGTHYSIHTPSDLVAVFEQLRANGIRVQVWLGRDGKVWGDVQTGRIGRSTGTCKIPLVVFNKRAHGGEALLDSCVVRVVTAKGHVLLWGTP